MQSLLNRPVAALLLAALMTGHCRTANADVSQSDDLNCENMIIEDGGKKEIMVRFC